MKTNFTKFLAIGSVALLMLASCKKDEVKVVATNGTVGTLGASSSTIVLTKADVGKTAVTFTWGKADFGYKAVVSSILQIDKKGNNFASPKEFNMGAGTLTQAFGTVDFNALLLAMNLPTGVASQVEVRLKAQLSSSYATYSNTIPLTVTPFALIAFVYVPGAYQGWNPGVADSLVSATGNGVYTGVINYTGADLHFKITSNRDWNHTNYGDAGGGTISTSGGDISAPAAGLQIVTVNTNTNTITFAQPNFYSIIGDAALGWSTDVPMKYINDGSSTWTATLPLASTGAFKIRQNNDWTFSWGVPQSGTDGYGIAGTLNDSKNDNITVASTGSHTVTFTIPLAVSKTPPPVTAKYTVK